ncbi:hypothetical protein B0H63DRAFT_474725 [Podospora didyma]|uniref:Uncharacterized protein n=1 Tax=Podospora didyma TaxID=330526 RepID=A0AAE0NGC3_9PEZI|nr:hypothetical protein B0H63DRAFT_474725 [Podospora didyma]
MADTNTPKSLRDFQDVVFREWTPTTPSWPHPQSDHHPDLSPETPSRPEPAVHLGHPESKENFDDSPPVYPNPNLQAPQQQWETGPPEHHVLRVWVWEFGGLFLSLGLMGAIVGLLVKYNGRQVSEWGLEMNLNTLVALLSAFLRALMAMVVGEVMGQIKWSWFSKQTHPLSHLQAFDSASRSSLGSLRLLGMLILRGHNGPGIMGMGAALVIAFSFAIGPFAQQAVKTGLCPQVITDVNSSIPVTNYVLGPYYRIAAGSWEVEVDMKGAMVQGLTNPRSGDSAIQPFCPTGNCTFPDYGTGVTHASLGVCSKCFDRTSTITGPDKESGNITLTIPHGLAGDETIVIRLESGAPFLNVAFSDLAGSRDPSDLAAYGLDPAVFPTALGAIYILSASNSPCTLTNGNLTCPHLDQPANASFLYGKVGDFVATTCTLYPCLKSYRAYVSGGHLHEEVVSTAPTTNNVSSLLGFNHTAVRSPCILDESGTWYTKANMSSAPRSASRTWSKPGDVAGTNDSLPNACLYKLEAIYARAMSQFMRSNLFEGTCSYDTRQGENLWCNDKWWLSPLYNKRNASFESLSAAVDDFATAVTNKLRTMGFGPDAERVGEDMRGTGFVAKGIVNQTSICTYFEWRWLLLPCALVAASAVLLVAIFARNARDDYEPVWKSNILPLLFFGLRVKHKITSPNGRDATNLSDIEAKSRDVKVKFVGDRQLDSPGLTSAPLGVIHGAGGYSMDSLMLNRRDERSSLRV